MSDDNVPTVISTSEIGVLGTKITVRYLDNGHRVVDAAEMERFLDVLHKSPQASWIFKRS